jgi:hypothetical protein
MKVRRVIASIPVRSAAETWQAITKLVTGPDSVGDETLRAAASVMESLIADEHLGTVPITIKGNGPRLVIYCHFNEAAMEAGKNIDPINWNPTGGNDWKMTAPSDAADVTWMNDTLKSRAPRITVFDFSSPPSDGEDDTMSANVSDAALKIDWGVLN